MKLLIFASLIYISFDVSTSNAFLFSNQLPVNVAKMIKFINSVPGLTWKAGDNGFPNILKLSQIKSKLGLIPHESNTPGFSSPSETTPDDDTLPINYDSRSKYPRCTTISSIKDQGECGSCWAVATAAVFSDRLCVHSGGRINVNVSADQLLACDKQSHGCNGGNLVTAWKYIETNGLITGGDYGSNEGCEPYSIKPDHTFFHLAAQETPECRRVPCSDNYKASNLREIPKNEYRIREEIYKNGPLTAGFTVYLSFLFYGKGIYSKLFIDLPLGGHAVRIIGWGEEKGKKYWLVANSWNRTWGENGTFKILRGVDNCGIESRMIAGIPTL